MKGVYSVYIEVPRGAMIKKNEKGEIEGLF